MDRHIFFHGVGSALAVCLIGLVLAGCARPALMANPQPLPSDAYDTTFHAAQKVLRDEGFRVNRADYRFGQITTQPQGSPTVLEPWHGHNRSPDIAWDSTLGSLRRTTRVSLEPADGETDPSDRASDAEQNAQADAADRPASYRVRVEVLLERYQSPQRRMNGSTQGVVFADLTEVPEELQDRGIAAAYWEPMGRDIPLEQHLLRQIISADR